MQTSNESVHGVLEGQQIRIGEMPQVFQGLFGVSHGKVSINHPSKFCLAMVVLLQTPVWKFSKSWSSSGDHRNLMVKQDLTELGFFKEGGSTGQNKVEGLEAPSLKQSSQQDGQGSVSISGTLKHSQQEDTESVPNAGTLKQSSQHDGRAGFISGLPKRAAAKSS
jgi:hypothetical protein